MGKKRKAPGRAAPPDEMDEPDARHARLGPINTYEDVADSEDQYFIDQDKIMLEEELISKRRKKEEDEMELSDEEVLAYSDQDSSDEHVAESRAAFRSSAKRTPGKSGSGGEDEADGEEDDDSGWWGPSRGEYYHADNLETEADAAEEEAEAKRLQQKKLSKMTEQDFVFDGDDWLAQQPGSPEDDDKTFTEVIRQVEVSEDMGPGERLRLLQSQYPEFDYLVNELQEAQPVLLVLKEQATKADPTPLAAVKYWVLGCYVAALASYFAILTSPARDSAGGQRTLDPVDLRDHDVMETLVKARDAWTRVKNMEAATAASKISQSRGDVRHILPEALDIAQKATQKAATGRVDAVSEKAKKKSKEAAGRAKAIEDSLADLYNLPLSGGGKKRSRPNAVSVEAADGNSDFGEEETLDARTASEKAARKKSLKFYTSQIAQKANKRVGASRDAGGDTDIPYRERLKDRQIRLAAEAEKRGRKESKHGADLGDDSDEGDVTAARAIREDENEYYDVVANESRKKKDDKAARYAAYAAASKADRVVQNEAIGEDGKRKINYTIEKNKGLTPRRRKEVRNPRVKKRKQFEAKQKKLKSMKPTWKGGEPKGGYQGELSGINAGVIKSVKL